LQQDFYSGWWLETTQVDTCSSKRFIMHTLVYLIHVSKFVFFFPPHSAWRGCLIQDHMLAHDGMFAIHFNLVLPPLLDHQAMYLVLVVSFGKPLVNIYSYIKVIGFKPP
jgi:hypothetical protein